MIPLIALHDIFPNQSEFNPAGDFEIFLKSVPARWVVYLMTDADDRTVQLLCVKNLRASLKRRLGGEETIGLAKRVNYREIIRHIHWRRVDSAFEADSVYLEAARVLFPESYQGMTGFRPAWFVHVNPATQFPRYTKTVDLTTRSGILLGPMEDKHMARKLVHLMENLFDLCRDYSILVQSPNAGPCPWKQMGKCAGPCDGTISMEGYRELVAFSAKVLSDPHDYIREQTLRMQQASKELRFETAQKVKEFVAQLSQLGKGQFRHVRPLTRFAYLAMQRGPREGTAKLFLITPGRIEEILGLPFEPQSSSEILRRALELSAERQNEPVTEIGAERIGVVAHHLFLAKAVHGVFLPMESLDEKSILKGYRELLKQKPASESEESEGVMKELQSL